MSYKNFAFNQPPGIQVVPSSDLSDRDRYGLGTRIRVSAGAPTYRRTWLQHGPGGWFDQEGNWRARTDELQVAHETVEIIQAVPRVVTA